MKIIRRTIIAGVAAWLLWLLFAEVCLSHQSGSTGRGGFPTIDRGELVDYLNSRGFTPVAPATDPTQESFQGSYQGSRQILVRLTTEATNAYGVYVETSYDYSGFRWSVSDSARKAQEFAETLNRWVSERYLRRANAQR